MRGAFPLEGTAVLPKVAKKRFPLHVAYDLRGVAKVHGDRFPLRVVGYTSESVFTPVFENDDDGVGKTLSRVVFRSALPVSAWYLRTIGDEPFSVPLVNRCELVPHKTLRKARVALEVESVSFHCLTYQGKAARRSVSEAAQPSPVC